MEPLLGDLQAWIVMKCCINPYAAGGYFGQYKKYAKILKNDWNPGMWVTHLESTPRELSNKYQHDRV